MRRDLPLPIIGVLALALAGCPDNNVPDAADATLGDAFVLRDVLMYDAPVGDHAQRDVNLDAPPSCLPADFAPAPPPPFTSTSDAPRSVQVSVSGEALAELGYDFTPNPAAGQAVFVDGWSLQFERYLVVLDHVRLNLPGPDPSMQAAVGGLVAQQDGPWVVNIHAHGILSGAGGPPETATPIALFTQTMSGGSFDATVRYAFSFDIVPANCNVHNVNLTGADLADLDAMVAHGWTTFLRGTATYHGDPSMGGAAFADYPRTVTFAFGFAAPASYVNCQNPELGAMETDRGVQPSTTAHVRAQITLHTDHFFWDQTDVEGTPLHFDPIAARAQGFGSDPSGEHFVTLDDLIGDNPTALTDRLGAPVTDRSVPSLEAAMLEAHPPPSYGIGSAGAAVIRDLRDFVTYDARGQGHLNSDGICFVQSNGPLTF